MDDEAIKQILARRQRAFEGKRPLFKDRQKARRNLEKQTLALREDLTSRREELLRRLRSTP